VGHRTSALTKNVCRVGDTPAGLAGLVWLASLSVAITFDIDNLSSKKEP
jgi:hypothetical protein